MTTSLCHNGYPAGAIFLSKMFTFVVGPDEQELNFHVALVADISKPLGDLMTAHTSEAGAGRAYLPNIDADTLTAFGQFAYSGTYLIPGPLPDCIASISELDQEHSTDLSKSRPASKNKAVKFDLTNYPSPMVMPPSDLWSEFSAARFDPRKEGNGPFVDCKTFLLLHAKLYVFSDQYDIPSLRAVAARNLKHDLRHLSLYQRTLAEIVALIDYTYSSTADSKTSESGSYEVPHVLRRMVAQYAACSLTYLKGNGEFHNLLGRGGQFVSDLLHYAIWNLK